MVGSLRVLPLWEEGPVWSLSGTENRAERKPPEELSELREELLDEEPQEELLDEELQEELLDEELQEELLERLEEEWEEEREEELEWELPL